MATCSQCKGAKVVHLTVQTYGKAEVEKMDVTCPTCRGTGVEPDPDVKLGPDLPYDEEQAKDGCQCDFMHDHGPGVCKQGPIHSTNYSALFGREGNRESEQHMLDHALQAIGASCLGELLNLEHKIHWCDIGRHGAFIGLSAREFQVAISFVAYFYAAEPGYGAWWTEQDSEGHVSLEFTHQAKVSPAPDYPWQWCGHSILFSRKQKSKLNEMDQDNMPFGAHYDPRLGKIIINLPK